MAVVLIMERPGRARSVHFGPHEVAFDSVRVEGAMRVAAVFGSSDPRLAVIRSKVENMRGVYRLVDVPDQDPEPVVAEPAPAASPVAPVSALAEAVVAGDPLLPIPVRLAKLNGWAYEDMTGAGNGDDFGPEGGYGHRSGLTMAEMALCVPPPAWEKLAATRYPWECEGFLPPSGLDFPARRPPPKVAPAAPEVLPAPAPDPAPGTLPTDVGDVDAGAGAEEPPPPPPDPAEVDAERQAALASYGDEETVQKAVTILRVVLAEAGGVAPTESKARYWLHQKNGLPNPKAKQLAALLAVASAPA